MNTFVNNGYRRSYLNTSSAITSGSVVITRSGSSGEIGIAVTDIAATTGTGELAMCGVHELPAATGAWSAGDVLYWSGTALTKATTGNTKAGTAVAAKTTAATTGSVLLNDRVGPN